MAPARARPQGSNLRQRIGSALVLAPVVLAAVVFGRPWLDLLVLAAASTLAWEWARLSQDGRFGAAGMLLLAEATLFVALLSLWPRADLLLGGVALACGLLWAGARVLGSPRPGWMATGFVYIALPCLAFVWLRQRPGTGLDLVALTLVATIAADTGAFFVGRALGGPRLAPRISPGKTWSGLCGGLGAAALAGAAYAGARQAAILPVAAVALGVGMVSAAGDLLESAAKRRFAVKDAGSLIPGHGGLLDRVDGLLLAGPAMALLVLAGWDFRR